MNKKENALKRKEKAEFDSFVVLARDGALQAFEKEGFENAEDMAQDVALRISAARLDILRNSNSLPAIAARLIMEAIAREKSRRRGLRLMDIETATSVPDVSTPYHFLIAKEIAGVAVGLDLDSLMMGDTLEDEAAHYGVSRQRAHQIISGLRDRMAEYLIK